MYIYMTCQQNMRREHDTKITNEYFENPVEVKYLLMSEPNRLSLEYKTFMLPAQSYEGFKGQQQLEIVLYCIENQFQMVINPLNTELNPICQ